MMYQAYTQIAEEFPTFEAAVEHLKYEPGADGKEPIAVLLLKGSNYLGAEAEEVDGAPGTEEDTQAYLITVVHDVAGNKFKIEYIVEFGTIPAEEEKDDDTGEDDVQPGSGDEDDSDQLDEGIGEGGEEPVETSVDEQPGVPHTSGLEEVE